MSFITGDFAFLDAQYANHKSDRYSDYAPHPWHDTNRPTARYDVDSVGEERLGYREFSRGSFPSWPSHTCTNALTTPPTKNERSNVQGISCNDPKFPKFVTVDV